LTRGKSSKEEAPGEKTPLKREHEKDEKEGKTSMYAIVGLGNPGKKYEVTRHNVGFLALDSIAKNHDIPITRIKHKGLVGEGWIGTTKVILLKPQTYMNKSGESVMEMLNFYKIPLENLIVVYDDIDLDPGRLRIRMKGSAGSHNGMRDIIRLIGSEDFPRIRIGIGRPEREKLSSFVLSKFREEEIKDVADAVERAAKAAESIVTEGLEKAMNRYNG